MTRGAHDGPGEKAAAARPQRAPRSALLYLDRPRILVVDDEIPICQAMQMALEHEGYEVRTAHSGGEAEACFRLEYFDLLIMDFRLKETRGDAVFYHAVGHQPHLRKRTVFITGDITPAAEQLISETGCPKVMKPFNFSELMNLLYSMLPHAGEETA